MTNPDFSTITQAPDRYKRDLPCPADVETWQTVTAQVKGFLYLFQKDENLNMDQPHPYKKLYLKQDRMVIASCCTCVACRKRWILRSLGSETDSAKAWLGCRIKSSALLGVKPSLSTYLHHEMPSLTFRCSLMVFFIVSSHTKKDTRALPQKQTTDRQNLCELPASSSGGHSGAGLPLALGLHCTVYPLLQLHTTLPPSFPPFFLLSVAWFLHQAFLGRCLKHG